MERQNAIHLNLKVVCQSNKTKYDTCSRRNFRSRVTQILLHTFHEEEIYKSSAM